MNAKAKKLLKRRLADAREACGFTQDYVAAKLGLRRSSIAQWESARRRNMPTVEHLVAVAKLYGCSVAHLVGELPPLVEVDTRLDVRLLPLTPEQERMASNRLEGHEEHTIQRRPLTAEEEAHACRGDSQWPPEVIAASLGAEPYDLRAMRRIREAGDRIEAALAGVNVQHPPCLVMASTPGGPGEKLANSGLIAGADLASDPDETVFGVVLGKEKAELAAGPFDWDEATSRFDCPFGPDCPICAGKPIAPRHFRWDATTAAVVGGGGGGGCHPSSADAEQIEADATGEEGCDVDEGGANFALECPWPEPVDATIPRGRFGRELDHSEFGVFAIDFKDLAGLEVEPIMWPTLESLGLPTLEQATAWVGDPPGMEGRNEGRPFSASDVLAGASRHRFDWARDQFVGRYSDQVERYRGMVEAAAGTQRELNTHTADALRYAMAGRFALVPTRWERFKAWIRDLVASVLERLGVRLP